MTASGLGYRSFSYNKMFLMKFILIQVTRNSNYIIRLFLGSSLQSLQNVLYYVTITFFHVPKNVILIMPEIRLILVCYDYAWKCGKLLFIYWILILGLYFLWHFCQIYWNNVTAELVFVCHCDVFSITPRSCCFCSI